MSQFVDIPYPLFCFVRFDSSVLRKPLSDLSVIDGLSIVIMLYTGEKVHTGEKCILFYYYFLNKNVKGKY